MNRCRFEPKIGGIYKIEAENLVLMGGVVAQWYGIVLAIKEIASLIPGHSAAALWLWASR